MQVITRSNAHRAGRPYALLTTTIRLRFDGRSTGVRLIIEGR